MLWISCFPKVGYIKLGKIWKDRRRERNETNINLKITFSPGPSGLQLSSFLIEHSYAAEKDTPAPSVQEIRKLKKMTSSLRPVTNHKIKSHFSIFNSGNLCSA